MKSLPGDEDLTGDQQESKANQQISIRAKLRLTGGRLSSVSIRISILIITIFMCCNAFNCYFTVLKNTLKTTTSWTQSYDQTIPICLMIIVNVSWTWS